MSAHGSEHPKGLQDPSGVQDGNLLHNLVVFARLLRHLGINVSATQVHALPRALELIDLGSRSEVKYAVRCLLVTRHEDLALFDQAFDWFWKRRDYSEAARRAAALITPAFVKPQKPPSRFVATSVAPLGQETLPPKGKIISIQTYSSDEALRRKDFGT